MLILACGARGFWGCEMAGGDDSTGRRTGGLDVSRLMGMSGMGRTPFPSIPIPPNPGAEMARDISHLVSVVERMEQTQREVADLLHRHLESTATWGDRDTSTRWTVMADASLQATYGEGEQAVTATLWGSDPFTGGPLVLVLSRAGEELHRSEHPNSVEALDEAERVGPELAGMHSDGQG